MDDPIAKATEFDEGVKGLTLEDLQSFANEAWQSEIDKYNSGSARERQYNYARAGTGLVWLLIGAKEAINRLVDAVKGLLGNWRRFVKQFPNDTKTYLGTLSQELKNQFKVDFSGAGEAVKRRFTEGMVRAWDKLFKEGNTVSDLLRKDIPTLEWFSKHGDNIPQSAADDLISAIDKPIKESLEDTQGRLTYVLDRPGQSNKVVSVHPTSSGQFKTTTYNPAYNPDLNPNIPVPLSVNKLTPDYINTSYMHPLQGNSVVKIKLSGNRNTDFARARAELGISSADETVNGGKSHLASYGRF